MKSLKLLICLFLIAGNAFSQKDTNHLRNLEGNRTKKQYNQRSQAFYFGLGDGCPSFGLIYDRRLTRNPNGLGIAVGVGYNAILSTSIYSLPLSVNYLLGKHTHFLEISGGPTILSRTIREEDYDLKVLNKASILMHASLGYRLQPINAAYFFRVGYSEIFHNYYYKNGIYFSIGYNF